MLTELEYLTCQEDHKIAAYTNTIGKLVKDGLRPNTQELGFEKITSTTNNELASSKNKSPE